MDRILMCIVAGMCMTACSGNMDQPYAGLQSELEAYVAEKEDARIGVAVIINDADTVAVNGDMDFPMLSVYKFPIALAVGDRCRMDRVGLDYMCGVTQADMLRDTYSPMLEKYGDVDSVGIPLRELLGYSLQLSDNNASDIVLKWAGGCGQVQEHLMAMDVQGVNVAATEAEMYADNALCYTNVSTPLAMAGLLNRFDKEYDDSISVGIKRLMETCDTGIDRLPAGFEDAATAIIGHKTGTGFILPDGRIMAVNDCGYVHLPDGHRYSIAVFIAESAYDMTTTSGLIADISRITYEYITSHNK